MKENTNSQSSAATGLGPAARTAILFGTSIGMLALAAPIAFLLGGAEGAVAAAVALAICLVGGLAALALEESLRGPAGVVGGTLLAMFARMGIPLLLFIAIYLRGGMLPEAGMAYYLLIFYPVLLVVETLTAVLRRNESAAALKAR